MHKIGWKVLIPLWILTGCTFSQNTQSAPLTGTTADITVTPRYTTGGYQSQTEVNPYDKGTIHHLVVSLLSVDSAMETPLFGSDGIAITKTISAENLDAPFSFTKLPIGTVYRIRAVAYKASDNLEANRISKDASFVDIPLIKTATATLFIPLADIAFDGQISPTTIIASGSVISTGGLEIATSSPIDNRR